LFRPFKTNEVSAPGKPWWIRYALAVTLSLLAAAFEILIDRITGEPIEPFLPAFGAILASIAWAGSGPGLVSTFGLTVWSAFDLSQRGSSAPHTFLLCLVLLVEGVLLSAGSARLSRAGAEAARSEAWYERLLAMATAGIWVHDTAGTIIYANARMAEMLGIRVEQLTGCKIDEFFLPSDRSVERVRAENLRNRGKEQFDRRLRRDNGSEMWALACCNVVDTESPAPETMLAVMTDITERKRAEFALRQSEESFRNLFEGVLEGVYQSTPEGRVLTANPMLMQMLGLTSTAQLNDVDIAKDLYVDPTMRRRLLERLEHEGGFQNVEYELRRRDGRIITVLENARVVRGDSGAVLYYEGTLTDISARKGIEEQLRRAQRMEALGRLAGGVAHDFSNVLTLITGYAQLALADTAPSHPARTSTEQVLLAAGSAMTLTRQLLSFSRRKARVDGSLDLNRAVESCKEVLSVLSLDGVPGNQVSLEFSLCADAAPVDAGKDQIEEIVLGLSAGVRRASPTAIRMEVKTEVLEIDEEFCRRCPSAQPGTCAVLSVRAFESANAGEPASHETRTLLADPLFDVTPDADNEAIGLYATQEIVAQCGGFVASHPAIPAALYAFLPFALAPFNEEPDEPVRDSARETILLVDDEPLVRELSRDMLERQGYRVVLASDAYEAERIGGNPGSFDLLITDNVMPGISGLELARRLRISHPDLKVLFISGYLQTMEHEGAEFPGAEFLQKPFSADTLGRKVRRILSLK
jgi:two-component system, cell cycle sensor histidine kinase and response regulator CckA